ASPPWGRLPVCLDGMAGWEPASPLECLIILAGGAYQVQPNQSVRKSPQATMSSRSPVKPRKARPLLPRSHHPSGPRGDRRPSNARLHQTSGSSNGGGGGTNTRGRLCGTIATGGTDTDDESTERLSCGGRGNVLVGGGAGTGGTGASPGGVSGTDR